MDNNPHLQANDGTLTLLDQEDFERLKSFTWYVNRSHGKPYFQRSVILSDGRRTTRQLHKDILDAPGKIVDHKDRDTLNNRRSNLRYTTYFGNTQNRTKPITGVTSKFLGVSWKTRNKKWCAQIGAHGKKIHLGLFVNEVEAARAFDAAAKTHFGEFASLNKYE